MNNRLFPKNVVTRKKKVPAKKPSAPPPPPVKKMPKPKKQPIQAPQQEELPKEPSELEKLTCRTSKEIPPPSIDEDDMEDDCSEDEDDSYSDKFVCNCEGLESFRVKNIELPKMIFLRHKNEQSIKEKSSFMIYFYSALTNNSPNGKSIYPYKSLMETCKKNTIELSIDWLDVEGNKNCTWKFGGARVQGLDLGSASYERPDISEAAIEISYDTINIDGIEF